MLIPDVYKYSSKWSYRMAFVILLLLLVRLETAQQENCMTMLYLVVVAACVFF